MSQLASKLTKIKSKVNYLPGAGVIAEGDSPILTLHLITKLDGNVTVTTMKDSMIEFPPTAFVPGGVYQIVIKSVKYHNPDDDGKFIGGQLSYKPSL